MCTVSVILPVYNRALLAAEALESIFAQTFTDIEVIVVDDGSADGTVQAIQKKIENHTSVNLIQQEHTGMPGQVRNRGAAEARGKYLAFLDSDDLWLPEKLEKQVRFMDDRRALKFSHTRERWVRNGREVSQKGQRHRREGDVFSDALKKCILGPSTVMMERQLFKETGGFRENLEIAEDYEYWLRITDRFPVGYIDEPLTIKQAGAWEQLSEKYGQIEVFRIQGLRDLAAGRRFGTSEHQRLAEAELAAKCRIYAAGCRKRGRADEAVEYERLARQCE